MRKSKSIFVKGVECEICHKVGSLQILGNYYRIRHYLRLVNNKPQFEYHRVDKTYIDGILANLKANPDQSDLNKPDQNVKANADQKDDLNSNQHDLSLQESNSKSEMGNQFLRILVPESTIRLEPVWV